MKSGTRFVGAAAAARAIPSAPPVPTRTIGAASNEEWLPAQSTAFTWIG
jgi:hypothetical protein